MIKKILLLIALLLFFIEETPVLAQSPSPPSQVPFLKSEEIITVAENETVTGDFFAAGETVEIYGTINGDVYAAGGQILIEGTVNGDVLAAGGNITIAGTVAQDVRIAGGNLQVNGIIEGNTTAAGGNITLANNAQLNGNLVFGGGNITVNAPVAGSLVGGGGTLTINSDIGGSITAGTSNLRLAPQAHVTGNVTYWSPEEAVLDPSATVSGTLIRNEPTRFEEREDARDTAQEAISVALLIWKAISFLSALAIGILLANFAPVYSRSVGMTISEQPWLSLGMGLLVLVITPVIAMILLITIIGIPLAGIVFALYALLLYFAKIAVALWIGHVLAPRLNIAPGVVGQFTLGIVVYGLLTLIPIVSLLLKIADVFGLGALVIAKSRLYRSLRTKKLL